MPRVSEREEAAHRTAQRWAVRVGVAVIAACAVTAIICCFLPGFAVYETNAEECFDRAMDLWGHSDAAPCQRWQRFVGTEPAGGADEIVAVVLMVLPGIYAWRRATAGAAAAWTALLLGGLVIVFAYAVLSYESSGDGCVSNTRREPLLASVVLSWSMFLVFIGPLVTWIVAVIIGRVARRAARRPSPLPRAEVR